MFLITTTGERENYTREGGHNMSGKNIRAIRVETALWEAFCEEIQKDVLFKNPSEAIRYFIAKYTIDQRKMNAPLKRDL